MRIRSLVALAVLSLLTPGFVAAQEDGATHKEITPLKFDLGPGGKIDTMAMDHEGRLLCGVSWSAGKRQPGKRKTPPGNPLADRGPRKYAVKVVSTEGKVLSTWPMEDVHPKMIHGNADGSIYIGGHGALASFDKDGKKLHLVELLDILDGQYADAHVSGVTASKDYFFVAFGYGFSLRAIEDVVRFDRDLTNPKVLVKRQYGCCAHIDLDTKDGVLLVAENSRHRVNRYDFEGKQLDTWGRRDRTSIKGFAACCNPVNFDFGPKDVLYTAESGIGRIKKYTADGKYLGLVGYVDTTKFDRGSRLAAMSCYIPVEVSADGKRVYVMDVRAYVIRVLVQKDTVSE